MVFQPMIFESTGGVSSETERVIKSLNRAVAANTDTPLGEVATRFWHRVGIELLRGAHRAFARRCVDRVDRGSLIVPAPFGVGSGLQVSEGV